jgi:uncharacterized membrane protein
MTTFMWIIWAILLVAIVAVLIALFSASDDFNESENQDD